VSKPNRDLPKSAAALLAALATTEGAPDAGRARGAEADASLLIVADLARREPDGSLIATGTGRAYLLRQAARDGAIDPFRAQHLSLARGLVETPQGHADVVIDEAESPLAWLARRKGRDGQPLILGVQLQAGERLRADFTRAQLTPRVTSSWDAAIAQGRRGQGGGGTFTDVVIAARERMHRALDAAGPEFAGLLLDVCCFLKGLEDVERERRWPQRCAKVVLQLGLDRLARHYGLAEHACGRQHVPIRTWSNSESELAAEI
jgi:hypothetical protein